MDTLAFGYILPTTGWILDLHQLETCAAERTRKKDAETESRRPIMPSLCRAVCPAFGVPSTAITRVPIGRVLHPCISEIHLLSTEDRPSPVPDPLHKNRIQPVRTGFPICSKKVLDIATGLSPSHFRELGVLY